MEQDSEAPDTIVLDGSPNVSEGSESCSMIFRWFH